MSPLYDCLLHSCRFDLQGEVIGVEVGKTSAESSSDASLKKVYNYLQLLRFTHLYRSSDCEVEANV